MARDMFGDVVKPSITVGSKQWYTLPLSILAHVGRHRCSDCDPADGGRRAADAPGDDGRVRGGPAAAAAAAPAAAAAAGRRAQADHGREPAAAPVEAPRRSSLRPASSKSARPAWWATSAASSAAFRAACRKRPRRRRPRPRRPCASAATSRRPRRSRTVPPTYPPIAQSARVQGVVILEATIGPDGHVQDVRVLRSIPLLDAAAIEAVKQWVYTPTLLNDVPVPVIMTVTVNFTLR